MPPMLMLPATLAITLILRQLTYTLLSTLFIVTPLRHIDAIRHIAIITRRIDESRRITPPSFIDVTPIHTRKHAARYAT